MPVVEEKQHHKSKDARYTVVVNREGDAANAKSFRIAPWQLFAIGSASVLCIIVIVLILWIYTPMGELIPIPNAELENKFGKELITLNQRVNSVMQQMLELKAYNLKLRKALGETMAVNDSGSVVAVPRSEVEDVKPKEKLPRQQSISSSINSVDWRSNALPMVPQPKSNNLSVSFPAIVPAEGYMSRGYDAEKNHFGIDIAGKTGTFVVAAADGNIVFAGWTNDAGYEVIISHTDGFMTFYKHNESVLRGVNMHVHRGEPIATLGSSGSTSSGPHLHFEIWKNGVPVNPVDYLVNINL